MTLTPKPEPSHRQIRKEDNRSFEQHVHDAVALLSVPLSSMHSRRALLYGISDHIARRHKLAEHSLQRMIGFGNQHWTEKAYASYKSTGRAKLKLEHPVPRGIVTEKLCPLDGDCEAPVPEVLVRRAIELFDITCWVHDDERKTLDRYVYERGLHSKTAMPPGWDITGHPWARYAAVQKIYPNDLSAWKPWFKHKTSAP